MSLRTVKKIKDLTKKDEDESKDEEEGLESIPEHKQKQYFMMLNASDDADEENDIEENEKEHDTQQKPASEQKKPTDSGAKKRKKKKNKDKNLKKTEEQDKTKENFPESLRKNQPEEEEKKAASFETSTYCLNIKLNLLNYNKELQRYFKNAKISEGFNQGDLSKKEAKRMKMLKNRQFKAHKTYYLSYGNKPIGPIPEKFVCEKISTDEFGNSIYAFTPSPKYINLQVYNTNND